MSEDLHYYLGIWVVVKNETARTLGEKSVRTVDTFDTTS